MGLLSKLIGKLETLPDPLIYAIIAVGATGAVLSTIHHVSTWRPRKRKGVKLKGAEGKKIEDSLPTWALGTLAKHVNFSVAFAAKKILVERALSEPCQTTLIKRLESPNVVIRTDSLFILKYIFEFKYKTRSTTSVEILLTADFAQDNKGMLQVLSFALSHSESILLALSRSIDSPEATKLAIQNLTFLMRVHRQFRLRYARNPLFIEWRQNPQNPLYSLSTVEGLLLVHDEPDRDDIFLSEVQQFIYYIGERNWPLVTGSLEETQLPPKVVDRFRQIWDTKSADKPPALPFPDPGERWFSDQESERSDGEDNEDESDYVSYEEFLMSVNNLNEEEDRQSVDFLEEPDPVTPEDLLAYFQAAEEAGLRSQDRRRGRRREQEGGQESAGTDGTAQPLREI